MKTITTVVMFWLVTIGIATTAGAQSGHELPKDLDQPVLKVEALYKAEGNNSLPMILIYPDGRVVKPISEDSNANFEITLDQKRLGELLDVMIVENKFLEIDVEDIKNEVLTDRKRRRLKPGFEFRIEMNLADKNHIVSVGNTWVYQRLVRGRVRHPGAEVFLRFLKVETLCRQISNWTLVGGEATMENIIKTANDKTQKKFPAAPQITEASILSIKAIEDDLVQIYFGVAKTKTSPALHVIVKKKKGEDDFDILVKLNEKREIHGSKPPTT